MKITTPIFSSDYHLFLKVINQGIDSHLEAFTKLKHEQKGNRLFLNFDKSEVHILVRRLRELETDESISWADDIESYDEEQ